VSVVIKPVTAFRSVAKKLVLVLLVVEALVAAKLLVTVAFEVVRLLIVPVVAKSVFTVPTVVEEVLRTV
jgi:hypothetical protein